MSLEALNALKQLNDTRQSGNEVQQGNLEKVQGEVQNQGTSEASRVDSLSLEVVKAEYESALHNAQITRLQQQQAREAAAVTVTAITAVGAAILGTADLAWNTIKDIAHANGAGNGGQWGKDGDKSETVNKIKDNDTKFLTDGKGTNIVVGSSDPKIKNSDIQKKMENTPGLITQERVGTNSMGGGIMDGMIKLDAKQAKALNAVTGGKFKAGDLLDPSEINDMNKLYAVAPDAAKQLFRAKSDEAEKENGGTVYMAKTNGKKDVTEVGAASISSSDVMDKMKNSGIIKDPNDKIQIDSKQAEKMGFVKDGKITLAGEMAGLGGKDREFKATDKGTIDAKSINNFDKLFSLNPKVATELLNYAEHDVQKRESGNFLSAFKGAVGNNDLFKSVNAKLEADGKSGQGLKKAGDVGKNFFNGVIQLAETVVPLMQAYLAAKDKAQNTAEELQMAMEKLAANEKKLKQLQALMLNAGAGGMGKI